MITQFIKTLKINYQVVMLKRRTSTCTNPPQSIRLTHSVDFVSAMLSLSFSVRKSTEYRFLFNLLSAVDLSCSGAFDNEFVQAVAM